MSDIDKKTILCIPGLGGHHSVFSEYAGLFPGYALSSMEFVNRQKTLIEARAVLSAAKEPLTLFCHCYSAQMGIQLAAEMPEKVSQLVFLEPFFSEFQPWMKALAPVNAALLAIVRGFSALGIRRRHLNYKPDYTALAKYPVYLQPLFDLRWQSLTDYLDKCYDILTYKLPRRVDTPTLMIFSPHGFSRDPAKRERLKKIFSKVRIVEMEAGTHNVITMGARAVAKVIRGSLNSQ